MKKLLYPLALTLTAFLILYSCSADEEDTTPSPSIIQTPEPEPPAPTPVVVQYTLTVTAGEGGSVSTEGGTFDEGTEVTITATPNEGYEFVGWEGSDNDSSSLTLTLNSNNNIQAIFQKIYFSINYDQIFVESPSSKPLIEYIRNLETDYYTISSKGWLGVEMREYHSGGDYQNTILNPGYFDFSIQNYHKIDFNNDSIEDIIFTVEFFPHTVEKQSNMGFLILLNNNDGTF